MVEWLVPISVFWTLAALYLGGAALRFEGGGGGRQLLGLALHFVFFLASWAAVRALLVSMIGSIFAVVAATIVAILLLRPLGRLAFRVCGVKLIPDPSAAPGL